MPKSDGIKIGIVTSRGGHLFQMYRLRQWWIKQERFWVTFPGSDVDSLLKKERVYFGFYPESRNVFNAIRNFFWAFWLLKKEQPDLLISCGAGIAPPFFYVGKLMGIKLIFIEPYDFVRYQSLSGRLVSPIVDKLLVQHRRLANSFKSAEYWGGVL